MLSALFHRWERRLASAARDRVTCPFDWGLEWIPANGHGRNVSPAETLEAWVGTVMADSDGFFTSPAVKSYDLAGEQLSFPSPYPTPHAENNTVYARYVPPRGGMGTRAVVVLPQWNADAEGHVGLCRLLARCGIGALRLSLPYHDRRMPPELRRADYIVSANVGRTIQVCRQAVLDARAAIDWLERQGYRRIGIVGSSLGSCLALLTMAHDRRIRIGAFNHVSPYFADVVWRGISTAHVRAGLEDHVDLDRLRRLWLPISPLPYLERIRDRRLLLVTARYDLTFPVDLSRQVISEVRRLGVPHRVTTLPCGHYTTGLAPFKWLDGWVLVRFFRGSL